MSNSTINENTITLTTKEIKMISKNDLDIIENGAYVENINNAKNKGIAHTVKHITPKRDIIITNGKPFTREEINSITSKDTDYRPLA